jgi:hypothetical protein
MATNADTAAATTGTDSTATAAAATPATAPAKQKTVADGDMESRRVFTTNEQGAATEHATNYLAKCMADFPDFENYPVAAPGLDGETGEFDPEIYTDGMNVAVAVLSQRGEGAGTSTVKAIVIYPSPSLDMVLASDEGRAWLESRVMEKELNHIAVRQLRKAENIGDVIDQMPRTLEDYITSNRESGGIMQAFEDLWKGVKKTLGIKFRPWLLANLSKREMRRGMESRSYALDNYPKLEDRGEGKESLFVLAAQLGKLQATKASLDPAIFDRWLSTRNEKEIETADEDDDISLDDLEAAFTTGETPAPATPAEPAAEGDAAATDDGDATDSTDATAAE